jgi:GntR family transcriptional regulator
MVERGGRAGDQVLGFRPLYRQVREILVRQIADGVWQPGQVLPSEPELAADLGVSQGTVRKALDDMTAENLVIRRQGRGTFVAKHDDARILFQFFRLTPDTGEQQLPVSKFIGVRLCHDDVAAATLGVSAKEPMLRIDRTRSLEGQPCVFENIFLPAARFPGLESRQLPNNLYGLYAAEFGTTIGQAKERLKAVAATATEADALGTPIGYPILRIERVAYSLDGMRIESRICWCRTDAFHYASDLR